MQSRFIRQFLLILTVTLVLCCPAPGYTDEIPSEYQVKAAYLYNFAKFIRWPDNAFSDEKAPLLIGILGEDCFNGNLAALGSRSVRKRLIQVQHCKTLKEAQTCHLLFINSSESKRLKSILNELKTRPIITVGESKKFAAHGGVIQFVTVRGRLRFIINLDAAKTNPIQIDAQLLSLAIEVLDTEK